MFDWQLESQHREESREIQSDEVEAAKDRAKSRWGDGRLGQQVDCERKKAEAELERLRALFRSDKKKPNQESGSTKPTNLI
jgi:hypothetical protein